MKQTSDLRIRSLTPLIPPRQLRERFPLTEEAAQTVHDARRTIQRILNRKERRLLAVVGPCSIHDPEAAREYGARLREFAPAVEDQLFLVMRAYFEKPRTTVGWRGLITDPRLDGSYDVAAGLSLARSLLVELNAADMPAATEMLDPIVPQYVADLISWAAIGARTTESQTHRNMVSGLSMPVGFKNGTDGNLQIAVDAMAAARQPQWFMGIDQEGRTSVLETTGNSDTHIILRGSRSGPNYRRPDIVYASELLKEAGFPALVMVDCNHGNSGKDPHKQHEVLRSVIDSVSAGYDQLMGFMIESNLRDGRQEIPRDTSTLRYGVSITDACLGWEETRELLSEAAKRLRDR